VFRKGLRDFGAELTEEPTRNLLFLGERKYNRYDLYAADV